MLPAKHSEVRLPRKSDYQTGRRIDEWTDRQSERQTDDGQGDPCLALCFAGTTKIVVRGSFHRSFYIVQSYVYRIMSMLHVSKMKNILPDKLPYDLPDPPLMPASIKGGSYWIILLCPVRI